MMELPTFHYNPEKASGLMILLSGLLQEYAGFKYASNSTAPICWDICHTSGSNEIKVCLTYKGTPFYSRTTNFDQGIGTLELIERISGSKSFLRSLWEIMHIHCLETYAGNRILICGNYKTSLR